MRETLTTTKILKFLAAALLCIMPMSVLGTVKVPGAIFTDKFSHLDPGAVVFIGSVNRVSPGVFRKEAGSLADYSVGEIKVLEILHGDPEGIENVYCKETFYRTGGCWERRTRHSTWLLPSDVVLLVARARPGVDSDGSPTTFMWVQSVNFLTSVCFDRESSIFEHSSVSYDEYESISCDSLTRFSVLLKTVHPVRSETGYKLADIDKALLEDL